MTSVRLSRKAQDAASLLISDLDERVRRTASQLAGAEGKEFADVEHVKEAFRSLMITIGLKFQDQLHNSQERRKA